MSTQVRLPQRIVVAIDGSEPSFKALSYASKLAGLTKSKVVVLHVMLLPPSATSRTLEAVRKDLSSKGNELLAKATGIAKSNGLDVETKMVETNHSVEMAIVDFAAQEKADLLVLGTKGTSGYGRLMLGSTAAGAVSFANCPVLAVR